MSDFFSPMGTLLMMTAIILDVFGLFCLIIDIIGDVEIGETLSWISDILGLIFIGGVSFVRARRAAFGVTKKEARKIISKRTGKFLLTFFGEILPIIGAFPFWTIYVYSELKSTEPVNV